MEEIPEDIQQAARGCIVAKEVEPSDLTVARIARAILAERKRRQRQTSDNLYMLQAYREMLGPIGLQVADLWRANGIQRVHHDWGPDAATMSGEERAKVLLDLEAALSSLPVGNER